MPVVTLLIVVYNQGNLKCFLQISKHFLLQLNQFFLVYNLLSSEQKNFYDLKKFLKSLHPHIYQLKSNLRVCLLNRYNNSFVIHTMWFDLHQLLKLVHKLQPFYCCYPQIIWVELMPVLFHNFLNQYLYIFL